MLSDDYCLWLSKRKISDARDIPAAFDLSSLRGYFLGGSLVPWLKSHGGAAAAAILEANGDYADINALLLYAFDLVPTLPAIIVTKRKTVPSKPPVTVRKVNPGSGSGFGYLGSGGSGFGSGRGSGFGSGVSGAAGFWFALGSGASSSGGSFVPGSGYFAVNAAAIITMPDYVKKTEKAADYDSRLNRYGYGIYLI